MDSSNIINDVLKDINDFRTNPKTVTKRCETVKTGVSRFKGNEQFVKEIDQFISQINSIESVNPLSLNDALTRAAEAQLADFIENQKFSNWIDDANLKALVERHVVGFKQIFMVADEGATTSNDVLNKILLNKLDKEKKNKKAMLDNTYKEIGIAHGVNNKNENIFVILLADAAKLRTKRKPSGDLTELKQAFDWFDVNKIGRIDPKETLGAMRTLGYATKNPVLFNIMKELDTPENQKNLIDFDTFAEHITDRVEDTQSESGLRRIFDLFVDDPHQDTISLSTLRRICKEIGEKTSEEDLKAMLDRSSANGTEITFKEFYDFMKRKYAE